MASPEPSSVDGNHFKIFEIRLASATRAGVMTQWRTHPESNAQNRRGGHAGRRCPHPERANHGRRRPASMAALRAWVRRERIRKSSASTLS